MRLTRQRAELATRSSSPTALATCAATSGSDVRVDVRLGDAGENVPEDRPLRVDHGPDGGRTDLRVRVPDGLLDPHDHVVDDVVDRPAVRGVPAHLVEDAALRVGVELPEILPPAVVGQGSDVGRLERGPQHERPGRKPDPIGSRWVAVLVPMLIGAPGSGVITRVAEERAVGDGGRYLGTHVRINGVDWMT